MTEGRPYAQMRRDQEHRAQDWREHGEAEARARWADMLVRLAHPVACRCASHAPGPPRE